MGQLDVLFHYVKTFFDKVSLYYNLTSRFAASVLQHLVRVTTIAYMRRFRRGPNAASRRVGCGGFAATFCRTTLLASLRVWCGGFAAALRRFAAFFRTPLDSPSSQCGYFATSLRRFAAASWCGGLAAAQRRFAAFLRTLPASPASQCGGFAIALRRIHVAFSWRRYCKTSDFVDTCNTNFVPKSNELIVK